MALAVIFSQKFGACLTRLSLVLVFSFLSLPVSAEKLYRFQDANGNTLLTNQVAPGGKKPLQSADKRYSKLVKVTWYADTNVHRYGNYGATEASVRPSASKNRSAFDPLIAAAAQQHRIDFGLIKAVIHTESGFNPRARSGPGAQGLMQLMPATAAQYRVDDVWDPAQNINAGSKHLSYLLKRYKDIRIALAAYNAGQGNVDRYGGIPPFTETRDYVARVMSRYQKLYAQAVPAVVSSRQ
ncbi:transglycosylase-like protein with SLT domain [Paraperlucidibaca baekdonensis]|uniref:Transglycosylase-like protein with SLT domain n=1 Tax=Paraperlucidibaca baekdonensis TaxID=748120 RepID=A0A3E0H239_9GAMM|nr:lytic transglycosylase domain-containing protein [Paraperlucidibaca baekdonensis]REH36936.1 transglycosylase-like protein with SLT domain [Paraperlucidibaca baekdonensis]